MYQKEAKMKITKEQLAMIGSMILRADPTAEYIHCSVNVKEMRIAIVIDKGENIDAESADIDWGW